MNSDWKRVKLGELCEVIAGQSPDSRYYNSDGNGVAFYQGKKDFGEKFIEAPTTWTTQVTKIAKQGDILMSVRAPVGPVNFATSECCIGRGLAAIRITGDLDQHFLYYQLKFLEPSIAGREGMVFASINKSEIASLPIWSCPLAEQKRIVRSLDEAFEGIAVAKANAEKNLQNVRVLFESHLHAVLAKGANGWKSAPLNEICDLISRGISPSYAEAGDTVVLNQRCVRNHQVDFGPSRRHDGSIKKVAEMRLLQPGDVLVNSTGVGTLGRVGQVITLPQRRTTVDSHITILRPRADLFVQKFFGYMLIAIEPSIALLGQGSGGQTELAKSALSAMHVTWPTSHAEQKRKIANLDALVGASDVLASGYLKKLAALDDLQKSLLSQAFLGELEAA